MLFIINKKSGYHDKLKESDSEFKHNPNRPYFVLKNFILEENLIDLAVPLCSNISEATQEEGLCIRCPDTDHMKVANAKVAGFDLSKAIPYDDRLFDRIVRYSGSLVDNEKIAKQNLPSLRGKLQKMLNDIENGKKPTYGTNIYKDIEIKNECVALLNSPTQKPQIQSNKQNTNTRVDKPSENHNDNNNTKNYLRDLNKATSKDDKVEIAKKFAAANPKFLDNIINNMASKSHSHKEAQNNKDNTNNNNNKNNKTP